MCDMQSCIPLSEFGDTLMSTMRNRTRRCEGKRICVPYWYIALRFLCESICVHGLLLTRVRSINFVVIDLIQS